MAYKKNKKAVAEVSDTTHARLVTWINESDDATQHAREMSEKARDYYDSKQWTEEEKQKLRKQKQAPTVINRCKPKMDALMGMEKSAKTTAKAFPRTPKHEKGAEAATEAIRYVLQDNAFDQVRSAVWENILIEGTGAAEIIVKPGKEMKIEINHIMWDRLIIDPHCRTKSFEPRTCRYLGQHIWMDYDEAAALYPEAKDILESMQSNSSTTDDKPRWMDNTRRRVKIVELYYRQDGDIWYSCFTLGGYCKAPQKSPYVNEEGETEWPYEFASPFVDREGGRYGAMLQLLDVQDEINKRRSKALHLMSVRQVRGEAGAVADINKAREELAKPDGYIETTPGMEFEVLKTGDMATAQFNLLAEAKAEIDNVGANAATQGKDSTVQSGVALLRRQQAGQTEVGPLFDTLKYWQYRVFRKVWNRVKQYWKEEKWIRVTDDEHNLRWVGLNAPMTKGQVILEQAQEAGLPPEQIQQIEQQIAQDPSMKEVVDTQNDIAQLDVDIIVSEVPDVLTAQIEDFQVLGEMVKSGFPMPPIAVIEASPLSNKDKLIKMMKEEQPPSPKVAQAMEQMQEQAKKAVEEAQRLAQENQALKADTQTEQQKLMVKAQSEQQQLAMKKQTADQEAQLAREEVTRKANYEVWKAKLEAATKIAVAEIGAKGATDQTLIKAQMDANLELIGALGPEGEEPQPAEAPAETVLTPIDKLMQAQAESSTVIQQHTEQIAQALSGLTAVMQQMADIQAKAGSQAERTRSISITGERYDSKGKLIGATVTPTLQ